AAANRAALAAPALPMAKVATGIPAGICTIDSSESMPLSALLCTGTPSTGTLVLAASMPGRCAAPPAPAMIARRPREAAAAAYSNSTSGVRCADTSRTSWATPSCSSRAAACCIVSQSEREPMTIPTSGVCPVAPMAAPVAGLQNGILAVQPHTGIRHGPQAPRHPRLPRHPPAAGRALQAGPGRPQPRDRDRRRAPHGRCRAGHAVARSPGHPRPQAGLPGRRRHSGTAGRRGDRHRAGRRFPEAVTGMAMRIPAPPAVQVEADVARALAEDIGGGDVTASLLPDTDDIAYLLCK